MVERQRRGHDSLRSVIGRVAMAALLAGCTATPTEPASILGGQQAPERSGSGPVACGMLGTGVVIGDATVMVAEQVAGGDYSATDGAKLTGLPAFCRVLALARPHPSSRVLVEIWLPEADAWNGKLLGTGNGGSAGKISSGALAGGLRRGFATANTDLGTYPAGVPGVAFNVGDGQPEILKDFGHRATHSMTVLAKEVVARHYGSAASKSFFAGCSTGGQQALMEAQRYPDDYDGIIAGAPAHNRTHLHVRFASLRELGNQPGAALPASARKLWSDAYLSECGGQDGGAPEDTFLTDPLACNASPRQLLCEPGDAEETCLTEPQVRALEAIYDGTRNPRTGELIAVADVLGAEPQLVQMVYGEAFFAPGFDITNWVLPADRDPSSFDFDDDMAALDERYAADVNAMDADLTRFAQRGGKLIIFHGWNDGAIGALDSIDYFERIAAGGGDVEDFARLFLLPGVGHCAGGPGPGEFGQLADIPLRPDASPENDLLLALAHWSETGTAPDAVIGRTGASGERPICAYPNIARYDGVGDPKGASSFGCVTAPRAVYERPAERYIR